MQPNFFNCRSIALLQRRRRSINLSLLVSLVLRLSLQPLLHWLLLLLRLLPLLLLLLLRATPGGIEVGP